MKMHTRTAKAPELRLCCSELRPYQGLRMLVT